MCGGAAQFFPAARRTMEKRCSAASWHPVEAEHAAAEMIIVHTDRGDANATTISPLIGTESLMYCGVKYVPYAAMYV